jgi:aminopeptidase N
MPWNRTSFLGGGADTLRQLRRRPSAGRLWGAPPPSYHQGATDRLRRDLRRRRNTPTAAPMRPTALFACLALLAPAALRGQQPERFTRADTLRGSITPERAWWDAAFYDLHVRVSPADSSISGWNGITYRVTGPAREMQVDLQQPLQVDSMAQDGRRVPFRRDGSALFATLAQPQPVGASKTLTVWYHGKPRVAHHAPWDGGFVWGRDSTGVQWIATAVQGLGASAWWPNKDTQADEPDSQRIAITVPGALTDVSNGRLRNTTRNADGTVTYEWFVANPINNYDVAVNAGRYAHFADSYAGEGGALTLDFWPLAYHENVARQQFQQVKPMLQCFEHWFGPYPWYADGYKLVETPHLGMEHQSAVAYGNHYQNGYLGRDLSHTGLGLKWDFIIVHESAHEWWGNSITTKDLADMWVHEAFANYAEGLYTECQQGKDAGAQYIIGNRRNVENDKPIVAPYGVNAEGSGDMYYKGGNMLHTLRQIIGDDERWRGILRGLQSTFGHQTVTGRQVQEYISRQSGIDFSRVFQQYLETTKIPVLEYRIRGRTLSYRWANVVPGFDMPVKVTLSPGAFSLIRPTERWKTVPVHLASPADFRVDENFYVDTRDAAHPASPAR